MFRLIKLALYGVAIYSLYEFFSGIRQQMPSEGEGQLSRGMEQAMSGDRGRASVLTGSGRGESVSSEEPSGMSTPHTVGRGVVKS